MAAGLFDEAVDLAQPETGALPRLLGREERVEGLLLHLARHAGAGVAHRDQHILPDGHAGILLRVARVDEGVAGLDRQPARAGHGVLGIDDEIEDRRLHLARVDLDLPESGAVDDFEIDVLAERPPEEIRHAGDQLIDVGQLGIERLAPREGQQPLRQHRRALRAVRGVGDHARQSLARGVAPGLQAALGDLQIAADDGEQIVEIMRDAAGQLSDRFHLLRLPKHVLGLAPVHALLRQRQLGRAKLRRGRQRKHFRQQRPQASRR